MMATTIIRSIRVKPCCVRCMSIPSAAMADVMNYRCPEGLIFLNAALGLPFKKIE